jgi:steroid delta-isomerase-like uncharacterized protein
MSLEANKATVQHLYEQLFNQGNLSVVDEVIAPDFINHNAPLGSNHGPESMRELITMLSTSFPDMHYTVEEIVAEGDTVVARVTMSGTHRGPGPVQGMPPTGQSVRQDQMHFIHFQDGKVVEHRAVRDDLGLMRQLGVIPAPAEAR